MALFSWLRSALYRVQSPASGRVLGVESPVPWRRWTEDERERVKRRLEAVGPDALTEDDYVKVAEYLIQRYAPDDTILKTESDFHKVLDNLRKKIRRNMAMTPEERAEAAKEAGASVDPEFIDWMDDRLSRVGTRTVGTPGSWSPSNVKSIGLDKDGFEVYRHDFVVELTTGLISASVETTALEIYPKVVAYIHDPEDGPDEEELEVIRLRWRAFGTQCHVSRVAIEEARIRGRISHDEVPVPGPDHETYLQALNAIIRDLEERWPGSTARPASNLKARTTETAILKLGLLPHRAGEPTPDIG